MVSPVLGHIRFASHFLVRGTDVKLTDLAGASFAPMSLRKRWVTVRAAEKREACPFAKGRDEHIISQRSSRYSHFGGAGHPRSEKESSEHHAKWASLRDTTFA